MKRNEIETPVVHCTSRPRNKYTCFGMVPSGDPAPGAVELKRHVFGNAIERVDIETPVYVTMSDDDVSMQKERTKLTCKLDEGNLRCW